MKGINNEPNPFNKKHHHYPARLIRLESISLEEAPAAASEGESFTAWAQKYYLFNNYYTA